MPDLLNARLKELDPRVMGEAVDRPDEDALFSYRAERTVPRSFHDFQEMLRAYYEYHCAVAGRREPQHLPRAEAAQAELHPGDS